METGAYKILLIDDQPLLLEVFRTAFKTIEKQQLSRNFIIQEVGSMEAAWIEIHQDMSKNFDLIILDFNSTFIIKNKVISGETLALKIKVKFPNVKLIICTNCKDRLRLINIFKNIDPDSFIHKQDVIFKDLLIAFESTMVDRIYYSHTIKSILRKLSNNKIILDEIDILILYEITNGSKMKELQEILALTKSGIDKRKRLIKEKLGIPGMSDRDLILEAKKRGFI